MAEASVLEWVFQRTWASALLLALWLLAPLLLLRARNLRQRLSAVLGWWLLGLFGLLLLI